MILFDSSFAKKLLSLWFVFLGECENKENKEWFGTEPTFRSFMEWLNEEAEKS